MLGTLIASTVAEGLLAYLVIMIWFSPAAAFCTALAYLRRKPKTARGFLRMALLLDAMLLLFAVTIAVEGLSSLRDSKAPSLGGWIVFLSTVPIFLVLIIAPFLLRGIHKRLRREGAL